MIGLTKSGKKSGNSLLRWIFGIIFVIIVIVGINAGLKDDQAAEEPLQGAQQAGEENLADTQVHAEETESNQEESNQDSGPEENNLTDNGPVTRENPGIGNLTVHFIDVGQGDSILLEYNGKTMLVDAGERDKGKVVTAYLQDQGISGIDYVVATHPHSDHIGGMNEVLNSFQVKHFVDSGFPHTSKTYENMLTTIDEKDIPFEVAEEGKEIEFDPAVDVEILNPGQEYSDDLNENSIVLKVSYGETSFLLMGDAGLETEEKLMGGGYDLDSDILKAGHHASRSGSGEAFISSVSPGISIIEVGAGNDYGHPHEEVLERLQKASRVYRTDLDGTIAVTTDGSTCTVITQKTGSEKVVTGTGTSENGADSPSIPIITRETESEEVKSEEAGEPGTGTISSSADHAVYVSDLNLKDEWIEITNRDASPVLLEGWKIEDEGSKHTYTFSSYTLSSQAAVTLYTGMGTDTSTELYWGSESPVWNNDGDTAYLYDNSGNLIAELER